MPVGDPPLVFFWGGGLGVKLRALGASLDRNIYGGVGGHSAPLGQVPWSRKAKQTLAFLGVTVLQLEASATSDAAGTMAPEEW